MVPTPSSRKADGKRLKFIVAGFSQNVLIFTNILFFGNVVSIVCKDQLILSTILLDFHETWQQSFWIADTWEESVGLLKVWLEVNDVTKI